MRIMRMPKLISGVHRDWQVYRLRRVESSTKDELLGDEVINKRIVRFLYAAQQRFFLVHKGCINAELQILESP